MEFIVKSKTPLPPDLEAGTMPSGLYRCMAPPQKREEYIDRLRSLNAQILEIRPVRLSLEDILVEAVQKEKQNPEQMGVWT